jgi:hypothetical protein
MRDDRICSRGKTGTLVVSSGGYQVRIEWCLVAKCWEIQRFAVGTSDRLCGNLVTKCCSQHCALGICGPLQHFNVFQPKWCLLRGSTDVGKSGGLSNPSRKTVGSHDRRIASTESPIAIEFPFYSFGKEPCTTGLKTCLVDEKPAFRTLARGYVAIGANMEL